MKNRYSNSSGPMSGPSTYKYLFDGIKPSGKAFHKTTTYVERVLKSAGKNAKRPVTLPQV